MKFNKSSFLKLSNKKQVNLIFQIIHTIEKEWNDLLERKKLLIELVKYIDFLSENKDILLEIREKFVKIVSYIDENISQKEFEDLIVPLENIYKISYKDYELVKDLQEYSHQLFQDILPFYIVLHNIRSAFNIGAIFRTAECLGVKKIYLSGYTADPFSNVKVSKTTMGSHHYIDFEKVEDIIDLIREFKEKQVEVISLETSRNGINIDEFKFKEKVVLLLGNERWGLNEEVLQASDGIVKIPINGIKKSLNVGIAFGIAGFEIKKQLTI